VSEKSRFQVSGIRCQVRKKKTEDRGIREFENEGFEDSGIRELKEEDWKYAFNS
jgi:hypothetical protein